jgi:5-formyltetrahydrofolate cyclo-ligase
MCNGRETKSQTLTKAALRRAAEQRRTAMDAARHYRAGEAVAGHGERLIADIGLERASVIAGYHPVRGEIDALALMARLGKAGYRLALPVTGETPGLRFRAWSPGAATAPGAFGIREPLESAIELIPDLVLLPLLGFDASGLRLGYGGGHYDRTLARLRDQRRVIAVGLAFDDQEIDAIPAEAHDQRLDWVITPSGARSLPEV